MDVDWATLRPARLFSVAYSLTTHPSVSTGFNTHYPLSKRIRPDHKLPPTQTQLPRRSNQIHCRLSGLMPPVGQCLQNRSHRHSLGFSNVINREPTMQIGSLNGLWKLVELYKAKKMALDFRRKLQPVNINGWEGWHVEVKACSHRAFNIKVYLTLKSA